MRGVQRIDRQRDSSRDGKIRCKEENTCEVEHVKVKYEGERDKDLQESAGESSRMDSKIADVRRLSNGGTRHRTPYRYIIQNE